jgi:integrase
MPRRRKDATRYHSKRLGQTIRLRADGRWTTQLELPRAEDGIRSRQDVYGKSPQEVEDRGLAIRGRCRAGLSPGRAKGTVSEALEQWYGELRGRAAHTMRIYRYQVDHLADELGDVPIARLSVKRLQQGFDRLAEDFCASYVTHMRARLKAALQPLVGRVLAVNPVDTVVLEPAEKSRARALSAAEARAFLAECLDKPHEAACGLMLLCGLRIGEALGLRWEDVSIAARTLSVEQQLQVFGREHRFVDPKTTSSRATIALPERMTGILERQRLQQAAWRLKAGPGWRQSGLVCTTKTGHPVERVSLRKLVHRRCAKAGITDVPPHGLRHSTATVLLELDVHPKIVQSTLRHSSFGITMDLYSHVSPGLQRKAAAALDAGLA